MLTLLRYVYRVVPGTTVATLVLAGASAGAGALLNLLIGRLVGEMPAVLDGAPLDSFLALFVAFGIVFVVGGVLPDLQLVAQLTLPAPPPTTCGRDWPSRCSSLAGSPDLDDPAVIDDGQLVEVGSHRDLLAADGRYAELFEVQARAYR